MICGDGNCFETGRVGWPTRLIVTEYYGDTVGIPEVSESRKKTGKGGTRQTWEK